MKKALASATLLGALSVCGCGSDRLDSLNDVVLQPTATVTTTTSTSTTTTSSSSSSTSSTSTSTTSTSTPAPVAKTLIGLAAGNTLRFFTDLAPNTTLRTLTVTLQDVSGVATGDQLVAIDFRAQNNALYGLARNETTGALSLYHLSLGSVTDSSATGTATGTRLGAGNLLPSVASAAATTRFDIDFNPSADRIRVVSSTGLNLRLNPNDGSLAGQDTNITLSGGGGAPAVSGAAYTNNEQNTTLTTLYTLDADDNALHIIANPNGGVESTTQTTSVNFDAVDGFDIARGVNVATAGQPVTAGTGYAALRVGAASTLYSVDLVNGGLTSLGALTTPLLSLSVVPSLTDFPLVGITGDGLGLTRFNSAGTTEPVTVAAPTLLPNEQFVALDYRPATAQLYAATFKNDTGGVHLYVVDPQTAALTQVGPNYPTASTTANTGWGLAFRAATDELLLTANIDNTGYTPLIDPDTGGITFTFNIFSDNAGTVPEGVSAVAFTNTFSISSTGASTLFAVDDIRNRLVSVNQTTGVATPVGPDFSIDINAFNGFFIPRTVSVTTTNGSITSAANTGLFLGNTGTGTANTTLYNLNLTTGALTPSRTFTTGMRGIAGF